MTYTSWPQNVNTKFYAHVETPKDNTIETEYSSGRKAVFLANTRFLHEITCKLSVTKTELTTFWTWYTNALGGKAGVFTCSSLGTGYYRFTDTPKLSEGQLIRTLELSIEEVY